MADKPSDFLVVEDPKKSSTWHLQVKKDGVPDHTLMGAAAAALTVGYRGNKYDGPGKSEALAKLKELYKSEKMPFPGDKAGKSLSLKTGARNSSADQKHLNAAHGHMTQALDHLQQAGAVAPDDETEGEEDDKTPAPAGKSFALKCMDMGYGYGEVPSFAAQEGLDAQSAAYALANICSLVIGEANEIMADADDAKDVTQLADLARGLMKFIDGELAEAEAAAGAEAAQAEQDDSDETQTARGQAAEAALAGKSHRRAVAPTPAEAYGRALASKAMTLNYVKSIGLPLTEQFLRDVVAVKSVGKDGITGYLALWGNPSEPDIEVDYFTGAAQKNAPNPPTDFWDDPKRLPLPLTWNHGQDRAVVKATELIGSIEETWDDEVGRAYNAILNRSHAYRAMVDKIISKRVAGTSSDSAPQYTIRQKSFGGLTWTQENGEGPWAGPDGKSRLFVPGAAWIKQWPLFAASLTDIPAEPRMLDVGSPYWKSIGIAEAVASGGRTAAAGPRLDSRLQQAHRDLELLELEFGSGLA